MATFTPEQVAQFANLYASHDPVTAVAVALAEHRGTVRTDAVSPTGDVGIWQINVASHPQWTREQLKDPTTNAEAMRQISDHGRNWSAWTGTYKIGLHLGYMARARQAVEATHGSVSDLPLSERLGDVAGAVTNPLDSITGAIGGIVSFLEWLSDPDTWRRIALVIAGGGIVLVGVAVVARGTDVGQAAEQVVTKGFSGGQTGGQTRQRKGA
jgi:hypothetical protein